MPPCRGGEEPTYLAAEGERIPFAILRGGPRRRRTLIRMTEDGVEVVLPPRAARREALAALEYRREWVLAQWRRLRLRPKLPAPQYGDGERHLFLGEYRRLELEEVSGTARHAGERTFDPFASGNGGSIRLQVRDADPETVRKQLRHWYEMQMRSVFSGTLAALCSCIPWLSGVPEWRIRWMRRRWGSCSGRGVITLNTHLIKAPPRCFEYVLLHELAHLQEHNHSPRYYAVLTALLPGWKAVRRELEEWAPRLFA